MVAGLLAGIGIGKITAVSEGCYRPLPAVRFMAGRCGAASPDRSFVHLAAFSEGEGWQSGLCCRLMQAFNPKCLTVICRFDTVTLHQRNNGHIMKSGIRGCHPYQKMPAKVGIECDCPKSEHNRAITRSLS